jgi:hypothetical protein
MYDMGTCPLVFECILKNVVGRTAAQQKSRRGTDQWSASLAARLAWRFSRYSPVALCHRLSTALLWAAQIAHKTFQPEVPHALGMLHF